MRNLRSSAFICGFILTLGGCGSTGLPEIPAVATDKFLPAVRSEVEKAVAAAKAQPRDAEVSGRLGMMLQTHGQYEAAITCYRRAHLLRPGEFRWLYYLGLSQSAVGRNEEAAEAFRAALRIKPDDVAGQVRLAEVTSSEELYRRILDRYPKTAAAATAWYGVGRSLAPRDPGGAAEAFRKAIELYPPYGSAHYALALAYRRLGDSGQAQKHLQLSEQFKNALPPVEDPLSDDLRVLNAGALDHIRRAQELDRAGQLEAALAEMEKALAADPTMVQAHVNMISLCGRLNQPARAERHFREAVRLNPNSAEAHYNFGVLAFGATRLKDAEAAFARALAINPFYAEAHNNLGYLLESQGRAAQAMEHYRKAIENKPDYRLAHFHLGRVLTNRRQFAEAIEHFQRTLSPEDDQTPGFLYALAAAYGRSGDRENGLRYARQARDRAAALGQTQLVSNIERDIQIMERHAR
jgi:tetratricopeptide (TPR) repeat protein